MSGRPPLRSRGECGPGRGVGGGAPRRAFLRGRQTSRPGPRKGLLPSLGVPRPDYPGCPAGLLLHPGPARSRTAVTSPQRSPHGRIPRRPVRFRASAVPSSLGLQLRHLTPTSFRPAATAAVRRCRLLPVGLGRSQAGLWRPRPCFSSFVCLIVLFRFMYIHISLF